MRTPWIMKVTWGVSLVLLALWFASAVLRQAPSKEAGGYFPQEFLSRARRRATLAYLSSGLGTLATFGILYLVGRESATGPLLSSFFRRGVTPGNAALLGLCLGVTAAVALSVVNLPFGIYGLYLDRSYGLSRMTLVAYLGDYAKSVFLSLLEYAFAGSFAAWALERFPRTWHLVVTGAFIIAAFVMSAIFPVLIAPMFNRFHPLPEGSTLADVRELAGKAGMRVDKVLVMEASVKTTRVNAYFAGVGSTKEVVLYDTLLDYPREQVRLVLAHELGHWKHGHLVKGLLASGVGVLAALFLFRAVFWTASASGGPGPAGIITSLPALERLLVALFIFATLVGYGLTPAASYISRRFEVQSDAYSLALTGDRTAFVSTRVNLARRNLGDVEPPPFIRWFAWTHPTTLERIRSASSH